MNEFEQKFPELVNAGFPYIYIPSYEEERVIESIRQMAQTSSRIKTARKVYTWTQTRGLSEDGSYNRETMQPPSVIEAIGASEEPAIFILKDFHVYFAPDRGSRPDYAIIRKLRDILPNLKSSRKSIVFISPQLIIPHDMEKEISILEYSLPTVEELDNKLCSLTTGIQAENVLLSVEERQKLVRAAQGLTMQEAENAFCRAIVQRKGLDIGALSIIHEEKNQVVKKAGVLEFINSDLGINDIGGLENMKNWLMKRNNSWGERAKQYHIPAPKGVLITGVPGCGKSLTAKAMSSSWGLPLLKLDVGKIFGGIVGSSEENMRRAIHTAEAVSPSILWVDEIEKGFAGAKSDTDSGTSARVFGTFLTWMQDKTAPVFVIATANDISALPPELLRKGRFDEIFFVDIPTKAEREKIFELHLTKRMTDSTIEHELELGHALYSELADATVGFVGAEIEQIVIAALYEAFYLNSGLRKEYLFKCIQETVPLSVTQKEQIRALREWAATRAVLATAREDREPGAVAQPGAPASIQGGRIVDFDL